MRNFSLYVCVAILFSLFLVGCMNNDKTDDRKVTIKNDNGEVLASTSDFAEASVEERAQDGEAISVNLKEKSKLEEVTETHVGESIHVYFGEKLISSSRIVTAIPGKSIVIEGDYNEELLGKW
ncbi:SecDF P1 head subdomain-containing protein [Oceanobacillus halotolerans]|uniref:SecDF P1 head subdomain-containing protein n=1 Tax=Oceanobacillus halotolerans TaxID=2663380 RepID=UPI0013DAB121|nr:hypothetical protein [Oceanobacillus halotolerans]